MPNSPKKSPISKQHNHKKFTNSSKNPTSSPTLSKRHRTPKKTQTIRISATFLSHTIEPKAIRGSVINVRVIWKRFVQGAYSMRRTILAECSPYVKLGLTRSAVLDMCTPWYIIHTPEGVNSVRSSLTWLQNEMLLFDVIGSISFVGSVGRGFWSFWMLQFCLGIVYFSIVGFGLLKFKRGVYFVRFVFASVVFIWLFL